MSRALSKLGPRAAAQLAVIAGGGSPPVAPPGHLQPARPPVPGRPTPARAGPSLPNQHAGRHLGFVNAGIHRIGRSAFYHKAFHDVTAGDNTVMLPSSVVAGYQAGPGGTRDRLGEPQSASARPASRALRASQRRQGALRDLGRCVGVVALGGPSPDRLLTGSRIRLIVSSCPRQSPRIQRTCSASTVCR